MIIVRIANKNALGLVGTEGVPFSVLETKMHANCVLDHYLDVFTGHLADDAPKPELRDSAYLMAKSHRIRGQTVLSRIEKYLIGIDAPPPVGCERDDRDRIEKVVRVVR